MVFVCTAMGVLYVEHANVLELCYIELLSGDGSPYSILSGNIFAPVCHAVHRAEYLGRYPFPAGTHPGQIHPQAGTPPSDRWSMRGRYTSYWNAFLFDLCNGGFMSWTSAFVVFQS